MTVNTLNIGANYIFYGKLVMLNQTLTLTSITKYQLGLICTAKPHKQFEITTAKFNQIIT